MADIPADGNIRVAWVTSIANKAAPTVAELNAGLLLTSIITADGLHRLAARHGRRRPTASWTRRSTPPVSARCRSTTRCCGSSSSRGRHDLQHAGQERGGVHRGHPPVAGVGHRLGDVAAADRRVPGEVQAAPWLDVDENSMERWEVSIAITAEPAFDAVVA
jgi:hypothetical protein